MPAKPFVVVIFCCVAFFGQAQKGIMPAIFLLADEIMLAADSLVISEDVINSQPNLPANPAGIGSLPNYLKQRVVRWEKTGNHKGEMKGWFANGQLAVSAQMRKAVLHGQWASWYENGSQRDQGHFVNGKPDGLWHAWYANGKLRCERNFSASKLQAISIAARPTNPKLAFYNLTNPNNGKGISQAIAASNSFKSVNTGDDRYEPPFKEGLLHGTFADYHSSGKLRDAGVYQEGLKDGLWMHRDINGRLLNAGYYQHGRRHGPWKDYTRDGQLSMLSEYKHGRLVIQKKYDPVSAGEFPAATEE